MSETIEIKLQRVVRWSNEVQRTMGEMESEMVALHFAIDELRVEIKSIRAAAPPGVDHPPRAGADLTSPAPAVSSAGTMSKPWLHYSEDADELQLCATDEPSMMRTTLPSGIRWRQSNDGALAGCSIPNALAMLRDAGFERIATHDCEERMAASDEDDGA